uniref:Uncharacterized protein n=1 Tax=Arundo donax TaxID=35708 RepID=A0A0A9DNU0_ARUDO
MAGVACCVLQWCQASRDGRRLGGVLGRE